MANTVKTENKLFLVGLWALKIIINKQVSKTLLAKTTEHLSKTKTKPKQTEQNKTSFS